ncbi:MAG: N-acetylgalactosamine-6-sulfatase [Verrucomicrobia bacterium]|nr:MAG: N-acetylgalactosamine-6-sulfatase [Verrucomicrobiota bacterium]
MKHLPPRRGLSLLTTLILTPLVASAAAEPPPPKPNIVFLFADDLGWGDLRFYGHPYAQTPHLDKLAAEGTRFTQCYATGVTCCPSRTGFMTSQFPARFAKYPADADFGDRVTITALLKQQGYATGHFGKWHIGPDPSAGTYGIDAIGADPEEPGGGRKASATERGRDAHLYDETVRFIESHKDQPFFVNVWNHIPHAPVNPSQTLLDAFGPLQVDESKFPPQMRETFARCKSAGGDVSEHLRAYLAEIRSIDAEIGRLLQRLDELGLREKTIVVFSSDQGPADILTPGTGPSEKAVAKKQQKRKNQGKPPLIATDESNPATNIRLNAMGHSGPFRGGKHPDLVKRLSVRLEAWKATLPTAYAKTASSDAENELQ